MKFNDLVSRALGHEGGYVNDPKDPGGETNWGISKRSYPNLNIKTLTRDDAIGIYKRDFWDIVKGDELPDGVAWALFDFAINSGSSTAVRYLQRAVGVADDGHWGPISAAAVKARPEWWVIMRLIAERMEYQGKLSTWATYGRGWNNRNAGNLRFGATDSEVL